MKLFNKILTVCLIIIAAFGTSCKREFHTDIISGTPPALQVQVNSAEGKPLSGVEVKLYADEAAWNAEGEALSVKQTGADGRIVFEKEQLKNPGIFYVIATSGTLKTKAKTPYLILNDGKTYFTIVLK